MTMTPDIQEAMRQLHAARRALWLARQMQVAAHDQMALVDDTIGALAKQVREAEQRAVKLIGHGIVTAAETFRLVLRIAALGHGRDLI